MFHSLKLTANKGKQILKQGIVKGENEAPNCIPASARSYELSSPTLFTSWAFSLLICESGTLKWTLLRLATVKVRMPHPPLTLICLIQVERQPVRWEGNGKLGLLSHQGTSWARGRRTFPGFLCAGGDPLEVWARTQNGAKALRGRETTNFTR